jgi:hypothetical protein
VKAMRWQPRIYRRSDFMMFDNEMNFKYWHKYERRKESRGDVCDVMGNLGACWMMERGQFRRLGYLDENHGSWGQMGTEISCKTWLSGGRQVVNKKTWYSHLFRTQGGDFSFPYPISDRQVNRAKEYSRDLWLGNKWKHAKKPLEWIVKKFAPVPTWENIYA